MLGVGLPEFILIAIAALIIIGPERMPEIAKAAAKAYVQLRKAGDELTKTVREIDPGPLLSERKSYASKGAAAPVETAPAAKPDSAPKPADTDDGARGTS